MAMSALFVVIGLVALALAADVLVVGASALALRWRVAPVVVGVVVIGAGTSAPEGVVSVLAAAEGDMGAAIGNIGGSNAANLTLLLAAAGFLAVGVVASTTMRREVPIAVAATIGFSVVVWLFPTTVGGRVAGGVLLTVGIVILVWLVRAARRDPTLVAETDDLADATTMTAAQAAVRVVGGLIVLALGGQILLTGALDIADRLGFSSGVAGATLVAVGTSLPELAAVSGAARRRQPDLVAGNLLGSNIMNSTIVAGPALLIGGGAVVAPVVLIAPPLAVLAGVAAFGRTMTVTRRGAGVLLAVFVATQVALFVL
jgi:cation:H+ antiporter